MSSKETFEETTNLLTNLLAQTVGKQIKALLHKCISVKGEPCNHQKHLRQKNTNCGPIQNQHGPTKVKNTDENGEI